ncbi:hypothetical protein PPL_08057 [Heterostelium album PN500]|uniref:Phosphatidylethanolamine-binding protein n=1 Tax=Heterostelium pallidum (strain ATCC 26659 / Pp 5 / PN500) TaxID=670386 RepID=D3BIH8_HETP5|nr:hypothetical protein PPL_08057 [Heterostelium album PN500]EFA78602.1 hypothetical protein PPL_08057 [Heterostelium album PN500]|eukprot:XP_020430726.1 hypothetical protein PPL_08057 [Heterostelium album PN500]
MESFLGWLFYNYRGRDSGLIINIPEVARIPATISLTSIDFKDNEHMPLTSSPAAPEGKNMSPQIQWENIPEEAKELVLILEDPDAPLPKPICHFVIKGIDPKTTKCINAGEMVASNPSITFAPAAFGRLGYHGPRPIKAHGSHRYIFQMYALSDQLPQPKNKDELVKQMIPLIISRGVLTGTFERK